MPSRRNVLKQLAAIGVLAGLGNLPGKAHAASSHSEEGAASATGRAVPYAGRSRPSGTGLGRLCRQR